jgi:glycosyltransferase involved in cell wall biosynthesis
MSKFIGIVVPVFNEEYRLDFDYFSKIAALPNIKLVFVDDASTDNSLALIRGFSERIENMTFLSLDENLGKANAVRFGLINLHRTFDCHFLGFLDADGAFSFEDVRGLSQKALGGAIGARLVDDMQDSNAINAYWSSRIGLSGRRINRSKVRFVLGRILANLISVFYRGLPWDTQSGFKLFKNEDIFISSIENDFKCKWLFDIELLLRLRKSDFGYMVWEEPLFTWRDVPGSKISFKGYLLIIKDFFYLLSMFRFERNSI